MSFVVMLLEPVYKEHLLIGYLVGVYGQVCLYNLESLPGNIPDRQ